MKNKICKGIVLALPIICLTVFSACKDPIKDYYGNGDYTGVGTETLLDVIKSNPEYSTFALLLEETGMEQLLAGDDVFTVWVPRNADMPSEMAHLDADQKVQFIKNHITVGAFTTNDLSKLYQVSTLSGRNMSTGVGNGGVYYVGGFTLVKTDMMCRNGVVQEIAGWFIPRPTLYEMLVDLSDDYSIYRDSLLGRTIKMIDQENSTPITTGENGEPIYDTVWLEENEILDVAEIDNAAGSFTMLVPTNDAMLNMYSEMTNYLNAAQYPISSKDTSKWVDWVLKASITEGPWLYLPNSYIPNYFWSSQYVSIETGPNSTRTGFLYDYDIDTKYQIAYDQTPKEFSNGWAYDLNVVRVPKAMYMTFADMTPWSIRKYGNPLSTTDPWGSSYGLDSWTEPVDYGASNVNDGEETVRIQFGRKGNRSDEAIKAEYTFKTVTEYITPNADPQQPSLVTLNLQNHMPGYYNIYIQLRNSNVDYEDSRLDSLQLIINGEPFVVRRILSGRYASYSASISTSTQYIPGTYGPAEVTLSLFPLDTSNSPDVEEELESNPNLYWAWRRIEVGRFEMYPDYNF